LHRLPVNLDLGHLDPIVEQCLIGIEPGALIDRGA
jgi:hypothetical protein